MEMLTLTVGLCHVGVVAGAWRQRLVLLVGNNRVGFTFRWRQNPKRCILHRSKMMDNRYVELR
jgi:hypothetical protein